MELTKHRIHLCVVSLSKTVALLATPGQRTQRRANTIRRALSRPPSRCPVFAIMFSPEASISSARSSLRNTRRRQRKDSDGLQQQPRRKRSKLNDDSFVAPADTHINGKGSPLMNGHAVQSVENSVVVVDMPVREKKAQPKRAPKEDNALYLVRHHAAIPTYRIER